MRENMSGNGRRCSVAQRPPVRRTAADLSDSARKRARKRRQHRRHILIFFYTFLFLIVLSAAAVLSLTVLFKITSVDVTGTSRYPLQAVVSASGIRVGDNLFRVNTDEASKKICRQLPYVETAAVSRQFPARIKISIKAADVWGTLKSGSRYLVLGKNGKVLESAAAPPNGCTELLGLSVKNAAAGQPAEFTAQNQSGLYENVLAALQKSGIGKITSVDFSQTSRILAVYDGRVSINLGDQTDLDFKLKFAKQLLKDDIKPSEKGTLNMSVASGTNKAYFDPDYGTDSSAAAKK